MTMPAKPCCSDPRPPRRGCTSRVPWAWFSATAGLSHAAMRILFLTFVAGLLLSGCRNKRSGTMDVPAVRIVAVLHRPTAGLTWANEREMLQLTPDEKDAISKTAIRGELEVVYTTGRGSGPQEVRII